jgi:hypothetical protein
MKNQYAKQKHSNRTGNKLNIIETDKRRTGVSKDQYLNSRKKISKGEGKQERTKHPIL